MRDDPVGGMRGIFAQRQRSQKPDLVRTVATRAPQAHRLPRWIGPTERVFSSRISSPKTPRVWGALSACAFSPPLFGDQGNRCRNLGPSFAYCSVPILKRISQIWDMLLSSPLAILCSSRFRSAGIRKASGASFRADIVRHSKKSGRIWLLRGLTLRTRYCMLLYEVYIHAHSLKNSHPEVDSGKPKTCSSLVANGN